MTTSKDILTHWVNDRDWALSLAVTLNLKQSRQVHDDNGGSYRVSLNEGHIDRTLRHFLNLLNRCVYGNNWRRYGRRVHVFSVQEQSSRHHLHLRLKVPVNRPTTFSEVKRNSEIFDRLIVSIPICWRKTDWGYGSNRVTFGDDGWTEYQMKNRTKSNVLDSVIWTNTYLPSTQS